VHIIDGRIRHSLLLEVYTSKGVGTEIVGTAANSAPENGAMGSKADCSGANQQDSPMNQQGSNTSG